MPTYDYECGACGHTFEQFQSITASPLKKCPSCGKNRIKRLIGAGGGFIFKGSGFYLTDYRSENYKQAAKADSENGASGSSAEKKSDGKSGAGDSGSGNGSGSSAGNGSGDTAAKNAGNGSATQKAIGNKAGKARAAD